MSPEKAPKGAQQHSSQNQQSHSQHQMGDRSRRNQQQRPQSSNTYSRGGRGGFERGGFDRGGARGGRGGPPDKHAFYGTFYDLIFNQHKFYENMIFLSAPKILQQAHIKI